MSCKCQSCGKQYKVDFLVSGKLWERIKPDGKAKGAGLLCGPCITARIEELDKYDAYELREL